ncbi:MAG: hypothetical protein GC159_07305 [Phycisphaera sp.]|nr:hypothetical protein [Phycisphaera sp.]
MPTTLTLPLPPRFSLAHAVCSYGYFILAPTVWDNDTRTLHRPLRTRAGRVVHARITQPAARTLRVACDVTVARADHAVLKQQVARVFRLDEDFAAWRRLNPAAARAKFDRTYRSPTLFEDIVKTITSCNVAWPNTVNMNRLLCAHVGTGGDFPTPGELAKWTPARLKKVCRVGYRAERIIRLARDVEAGRLDLAWFEHVDRTTDELYDALLAIHGIGPYAAANMLQLLGHYDRLPVDTETVRHFRQTHDVHGELPEIAKIAHKHYDGFAPYQFLAYWFELWGDYQSHVGPAQQWTEEDHTAFTASKLK